MAITTEDAVMALERPAFLAAFPLFRSFRRSAHNLRSVSAEVLFDAWCVGTHNLRPVSAGALRYVIECGDSGQPV